MVVGSSPVAVTTAFQSKKISDQVIFFNTAAKCEYVIIPKSTPSNMFFKRDFEQIANKQCVTL